MLTTVSVCDEVTAPFAAVLAERADAGDVLAELERTTALVTGSGTARGTFRVHPLLRAQLRADLRRRRPDRFAALHGRVARARQEHGDMVGALHHAALADDAVLLGELLDVHGPALASGGHHAVVLAALDALPVADVSARSRLLLISALAHAEVGRRAVAHRLLTRADAVWPADPDPGLATLRAQARARLGPIGPSGSDAPDPRAEPGIGTAVVDVLLRVDHALAAGQWDEAESLARAAGAEAARQGNTYLEARAVVTLGVVRSLRGDVTDSVALARRAAEIAPADRWRGTVGDAYACLLQGYGALLRFRSEECLRWVAEVDRVTAVHPAPPEPAGVVSVLGVLRAAARFDLGKHRAGLAALTAARAEVDGDQPLGRPMLAFAAAVEHGAAAALGMRAHARTVAEWAHARLGSTGDVLVMQAWGPAAIGRDDAARERLRPVLDGSVPCAVPWMRDGGGAARRRARAAGRQRRARAARGGSGRGGRGDDRCTAPARHGTAGHRGAARRARALPRPGRAPPRGPGTARGPGPDAAGHPADRPRARRPRTSADGAVARGDRGHAGRLAQHGAQSRPVAARQARGGLAGGGGAGGDPQRSARRAVRASFHPLLGRLRRGGGVIVCGVAPARGHAVHRAAAGEGPTWTIAQRRRPPRAAPDRTGGATSSVSRGCSRNARAAPSPT